MLASGTKITSLKLLEDMLFEKIMSRYNSTQPNTRHIVENTNILRYIPSAKCERAFIGIREQRQAKAKSYSDLELGVSDLGCLGA